MTPHWLKVPRPPLLAFRPTLGSTLSSLPGIAQHELHDGCEMSPHPRFPSIPIRSPSISKHICPTHTVHTGLHAHELVLKSLRSPAVVSAEPVLRCSAPSPPTVTSAASPLAPGDPGSSNAQVLGSWSALLCSCVRSQYHTCLPPAAVPRLGALQSAVPLSASPSMALSPWHVHKVLPALLRCLSLSPPVSHPA